MIPTFAMVGVSGGTFSLSDAIAPLYGIVLGPFAGAISVILGTILAIAFGRPMIFLGLDFLPSAMDALVVGLVMRKKRLAAIILYFVFFIMFLANPYTAIFVPVSIPLLNLNGFFFYPWLHLIALVVLISPLSKKAAEWVNAGSLVNLAPGLLILSFIGALTQHLVGGLLYEMVLGMFLREAPEVFRLVWNIVFWLYPFERAFIIVLSTVIGVPLIKALKSSRILTGSSS
jgi:Na+/phosphate symporter